jgi:predicted MFS family arabinose efflux permease
MAVTGIVNTGGNLGGVIGIPIVAYLSAAQRWDIAFGLGVVFAIVAALLWLIVDVDHPIPHRGIAEG